ncbi:MAG: site-specific DNA-methyltransferase [Anaerolineae bacterium]|nr:site-specific DNA-methyltransferase [Anaerolineae bacterium]
MQEAADVVNKTVHNIRDYIQRGRIAKYNPQGDVITRAKSGELRVDLDELRAFLKLVAQGDEDHHQAGLHAELGFYGLAERERTKHVHRLHPYLGKFIPQLVEWFLTRYFKQDDIILDPFMGSGTMLIQANELGMHAIGVDISEFCYRIVKAKTQQYDISKTRQEILKIEYLTTQFSRDWVQPSQQLSLFAGDDVHAMANRLIQNCDSEYMKIWFAPRALVEILYYRHLIETGAFEYQDLLRVLLSRAMRSSRLVSHFDLATPKQPLPVGVEYWCRKHNRMCLPIDNCITKIHAYSQDTVRRIETFSQLRTSAEIHPLHGDSRQIDLTPVLQGRKIAGIFSSPPYVGQIDYHDQHNYAYELFNIPRNDDLEIGPKSNGKSKRAQQAYIEGIADVLRHTKQYLIEDANIFLVANDSFGLYPQIARASGLKIVEEFQRAVTKRTEQGNDPYQETIFWMKKDE